MGIQLQYFQFNSNCFWATVYGSTYAIGPLSVLSVLFVTLVYCGQTVGWIKMPLCLEVGLGSGHIVIDGDPLPPKKEHSPRPNFRPMSVVVKRLDGSRCHLVGRYASAQATLCQMGTQLSPSKMGPQQPLLFYPYLLWPKGQMDQDAAWYGGRPQPRPHCVRQGPSSSPRKGTQPPLFGPCLLRPNGRPSQQLLNSCSSMKNSLTKVVS